jgi:GTP-binding protein
VAITKCDLLDEELQREIAADLSLPVPYVFVSAVSNMGLEPLKDQIWRALQ